MRFFFIINIETNYIMRLLELFAGTQSVGKIARELEMDVISLDRDMPADISTDIMNWDYTQYPKGHFDVIWASPPCTEYSVAKTIGVRDIEGANEVVQQTLDILEHFVPKYWMIENPQTGLLKNQLCMYGMPFVDVDYCKYGMPYRKRTRIWNNVFHWKPRALCMRDCGSMDETGKRHQATAQRGPCTRGDTKDHNRQSQSQLYSVPPDLIRELLESILRSQ